jgi:hypothetical protein
MKALVETLVQRREALIACSSAQRAELGASVSRLRRDAAMSVMQTLVRGWAAYALLRRLSR